MLDGICKLPGNSLSGFSLGFGRRDMGLSVCKGVVVYTSESDGGAIGCIEFLCFLHQRQS